MLGLLRQPAGARMTTANRGVFTDEEYANMRAADGCAPLACNVPGHTRTGCVECAQCGAWVDVLEMTAANEMQAREDERARVRAALAIGEGLAERAGRVALIEVSERVGLARKAARKAREQIRR